MNFKLLIVSSAAVLFARMASGQPELPECAIGVDTVACETPFGDEGYFVHCVEDGQGANLRGNRNRAGEGNGRFGVGLGRLSRSKCVPVDATTFQGMGPFGFGNGLGPFGFGNGEGPFGEGNGQGPFGERNRQGPYGEGKGQGPFGEGNGQGPFGEGNGQGPFGEGNGQGPFGDGEGNGQGPFGEGNGQGPFGEGNGQGPFGEGNGQGPFGDGEGNGQGPFGEGNRQGQGPFGEGNGQGPFGGGRQLACGCDGDCPKPVECPCGCEINLPFRGTMQGSMAIVTRGDGTPFNTCLPPVYADADTYTCIEDCTRLR